jgi:hypothetical protein
MMRRIDVEFNGLTYIFRSNDDGSYLFVGHSLNRQICTESGYDSLSRMKNRIRKYLRYDYELRSFSPSRTPEYPRIKYFPDNSNWSK